MVSGAMGRKWDIKVWLESVVRPLLAKECADPEQLAVLHVGRDRGDAIGEVMAPYVFSVLAALADYDDFEPLPNRMEHMTEPQLGEHLARQLRFIEGSQTQDTIGSMLVIFQEDGVTQYGATVDPETVPDALRELAGRIEYRETIKRP